MASIHTTVRGNTEAIHLILDRLFKVEQTVGLVDTPAGGRRKTKRRKTKRRKTKTKLRRKRKLRRKTKRK